MVQSDGHRLILSERSGGSLDVTLTRPASRDQIGNLPSSDGVLKVIHWSTRGTLDRVLL